jgi:ribonuclease J
MIKKNENQNKDKAGAQPERQRPTPPPIRPRPARTPLPAQQHAPQNTSRNIARPAASQRPIAQPSAGPVFVRHIPGQSAPTHTSSTNPTRSGAASGKAPMGHGHSRRDNNRRPQPAVGAATPAMRNKMGPHQVVTPDARAKSDPEAVRLVPLGGLEEIGRNCSFIEYKNEIVIIDMGLQFPEEETPGIDYIIPNIEYLEKKKQNIAAIILTHGHYDHIGALPHVLARLGNPPIYASSITKAIIEKRADDFPNAPKMQIQLIKSGDEMKLSNNITALFFGVPHTIPETIGVMLKTPIGNIVHFADFRLDYDDEGNVHGIEEFEKLGKMGVHTFMVDSTAAERPGHSVSEKTVEKNLEEIFRAAEGRIIVATFASLITRIAEIIKIAEKLGRKVALNGYSMKTNIAIAQGLGFVQAHADTLIGVEEVSKMKDNKILILSTGAQGESNAGLMKMINGEHRHIKIKEGDTFVLSSSVIPGNERSVQTVKDNLARQGAIVFHSALVDIHSSGHAPKGDIALVIKLLKPKFLMPVHGYYFMRAANGVTARESGVLKENVRLMDNGQVAELTKDAFVVTKEEVPAYYVMVDGLGVGDVEEVVLRDRRALAQEGMLVIILTTDRDKGKLIKNPDIISRGFIYLKDNQEMLDEIRKRIRSLVQRIPNYHEVDPDYVKTLIRDQVGQFIYMKTKRRPMILPVIIEI